MCFCGDKTFCFGRYKTVNGKSASHLKLLYELDNAMMINFFEIIYIVET